jgi:hypothetical protein
MCSTEEGKDREGREPWRGQWKGRRTTNTSPWTRPVELHELRTTSTHRQPPACPPKAPRAGHREASSPPLSISPRPALRPPRSPRPLCLPVRRQRREDRAGTARDHFFYCYRSRQVRGRGARARRRLWRGMKSVWRGGGGGRERWRIGLAPVGVSGRGDRGDTGMIMSQHAVRHVPNTREAGCLCVVESLAGGRRCLRDLEYPPR